MEKVRLGDICVKQSSKLAQKDLENMDGSYPIFGASGLIKKINTYDQKAEYVAVVKDGAGVGRTMLLPAYSSVIGTLQYLIPNDNVNAKYLYYAVKSRHLEKYYTGSAIPHIYFKDYKSEPIILFDGIAQKKIALVLERVEKIIEKHKQQLEMLDTLIKARFIEMFGDQKANPFEWPQTTIGDCCILKSGTSLPADKENEGGAIPYVKVGDMNYPGNEQYITTSSRFVTEQTARAGIFPAGTVIFPKRGGAIGTNKKRLTTLPICADLNVMGVTAGSALKSQYLMAYFNMVDLGALDNGSSVPQINNKDIAPLVICLPPLELQEQFAVFAEQVDKSKSAIQKSLEKTQTLFDSLMQEYFG